MWEGRREINSEGKSPWVTQQPRTTWGLRTGNHGHLSLEKLALKKLAQPYLMQRSRQQ